MGRILPERCGNKTKGKGSVKEDQAQNIGCLGRESWHRGGNESIKGEEPRDQRLFITISPYHPTQCLGHQ